MFWYVIIGVCIFAAWMTWEFHKAPVMEDENTEFIDDPTTTCWHDDYDHHPDQPI
jgi:hypothetical protein